jgi:hypothetical protein
MPAPEEKCPICGRGPKQKTVKRTRAQSPIDWDIDVMTNISVIENILGTGILDHYQRGNHAGITLAMCAFTQVMINLADLLTKADNEGERVNLPPEAGDLDITQFIVDMRNSACHVQSPENRIVGGSKWTFNMHGLPDGDIAYSYGNRAIGYRGMLLPVFDEVRGRLRPKIGTPPQPTE